MSEENGGEGYPCALKDQVDGAGGALEACLPDLVSHPEIAAKWKRALETGDVAGLQDFVASSLGGLSVLQNRELIKILKDGLAIEETLYSKDGDELGSRTVANPAAKPFLELTRLLGLTAPDQRLTPKSQDQAARDQGIGALVDFMTDRRRALEDG